MVTTDSPNSSSVTLRLVLSVNRMRPGPFSAQFSEGDLLSSQLVDYTQNKLIINGNGTVILLLRASISFPMFCCVYAKSLQSCLTLCNPTDCSLSGSSVHGIPGRNTGVGCHALLQGDLPDPRTEPVSLKSPALVGRFFSTNTTWEAYFPCAFSPQRGALS